MIFSRSLKILAIIVVLLVAGTYTVYALDYKGNYNFTAQVRVHISVAGTFETVALTDFSYHSEPTSPVQFWDLFRGTAGGGGHGHEAISGDYLVTWTLNTDRSNGDRTLFSVDNVPRGETKVFKLSMENEPPGHGTLKITVKNDMTGWIVFTSEPYSVVIG